MFGRLAVSLIVLPVLLIAIEAGLRFLSFSPGMINSGGGLMDNVKEVELSRSFAVDSFGILSYSQAAVAEINAGINGKQSCSICLTNFFGREDNIAEQIIHYQSGRYKKLPIFCFADSIEQNKDLQKDAYLCAIVRYTQQPFNEDGFRSIPFKNFKHEAPNNRKTVLLLGDSYTFGCNAEPLTGSFYDEMLCDSRYVVYNSGIIGADPVQYLVVVKKYIDILRPDYVIINFCEANDFMPYERQSLPYVYPQYPVHNAMFTANPYGRHLTFNEAKDVVLLNGCIPNQHKNRFRRLMAKSSLTTRLWVAGNRIFNKGELQEDERLLHYKYPLIPTAGDGYTVGILDSIYSLCRESKLILSYIPDYCNESRRSVSVDGLRCLDKFNPVIPSVNATWYDCGSQHFNIYGHKQYAAFLLSKLDSAERAN